MPDAQPSPSLLFDTADASLLDQRLPGATVELQRGFIAPGERAQIRHDLTRTIAWEQHEVVVKDKTFKQPRLVAWYGTAAYTYSGLRLEPTPLTPLLTSLQAKVEAATCHNFNSVLLNRYVAGRNHGMGHHADNEKELGRDPVIAMLSFGEGRFLEFKTRSWLAEREPSARTARIETSDGSLLVMRGRTQSNWTHGVPKAFGERDRITLTFRKIF